MIKLKNIKMWLTSVLLCLFTSLAFSQADEGDASIAKAEEELIRLESTFVGDKEQPTVTYFVPWKGTDSPDDLKWKIERKNDDTLNLVDRDIMLRSMNIYNEMSLEE